MYACLNGIIVCEDLAQMRHMLPAPCLHACLSLGSRRSHLHHLYRLESLAQVHGTCAPCVHPPNGLTTAACMTVPAGDLALPCNDQPLSSGVSQAVKL